MPFYAYLPPNLFTCSTRSNTPTRFYLITCCLAQIGATTQPKQDSPLYIPIEVEEMNLFKIDVQAMGDYGSRFKNIKCSNPKSHPRGACLANISLKIRCRSADFAKSFYNSLYYTTLPNKDSKLDIDLINHLYIFKRRLCDEYPLSGIHQQLALDLNNRIMDKEIHSKNLQLYFKKPNNSYLLVQDLSIKIKTMRQHKYKLCYKLI